MFTFAVINSFCVEYNFFMSRVEKFAGLGLRASFCGFGCYTRPTKKNHLPFLLKDTNLELFGTLRARPIVLQL